MSDRIVVCARYVLFSKYRDNGTFGKQISRTLNMYNIYLDNWSLFPKILLSCVVQANCNIRCSDIRFYIHKCENINN